MQAHTHTHTHTQGKYCLDLDIIVLEGSRLKSPGVFKNSYHVVATNVAVASNTGPLRALVRGFVDAHCNNSLFFHDGESIIDMTVYSKNRLLRTPLSCKLDDATKTALRLLQPWCGTNITDAFVTNVPADLPLIKPREDFGQSISARKAKSATCRAGQKAEIAQSQATSLVLDEVVQELQAMLDAAGSKGCEVTPHALPPGPSGSQSVICKNVGTRVCLVSDGEEHVHNNAWLNVHEDGSVFYHCHAAGCKTKRPKHIGSLDRDLLMEQYDSSESSVACTMEVDHEESHGS